MLLTDTPNTNYALLPNYDSARPGSAGLIPACAEPALWVSSVIPLPTYFRAFRAGPT